ncbi:MAG: RnfABCDGE type electron transport complex subunit D [Buchnera aphidicola (Nurudea yanoniella)]
MNYQNIKISNIYACRDTSSIMLLVVLAMIPGIIMECYYFTIAVLIQIFLSSITSVIFEIIILKLRKKNIYINIFDYSAIVSGILLGLSVPAFSPWWISVIGSFFSIVVTKHLYGGLGNNIFNPAMSGYAILLISFPAIMTNWSFQNNLNVIDTLSIKNIISIIFFTNLKDYFETLSQFFNLSFFITQATPLEQIRIDNRNISIFHFTDFSIFFENILIYRHWILINISFLVGGLFLLTKKIICWRISLGFLFSIFFCYSLDFLFFEKNKLFPLIPLFLGNTMIGAFFISTDPITTSITKIGRIIFGLVIGTLIWIIRVFGGYPDAISFSILLANSVVPLLDFYTRTRIYGK